MGEFRHLTDEGVYQGHAWHVVNAEFEDPDGGRFDRDIVRSPGAVAALPVRFGADGPEVVLVRQYRAPFDELLLEVPAGMRDIDDEPTHITANRELVEEAGLHAGTLTPMVVYYPAAGMTDSVLHLFLATHLSERPREAHGPEETHMDVLAMPLSEAVEMVLDGRIRDGKTVIALLLAERMHAAGTLTG